MVRTGDGSAARSADHAGQATRMPCPSVSGREVFFVANEPERLVQIHAFQRAMARFGLVRTGRVEEADGPATIVSCDAIIARKTGGRQAHSRGARQSRLRPPVNSAAQAVGNLCRGDGTDQPAYQGSEPDCRSRTRQGPQAFRARRNARERREETNRFALEVRPAAMTRRGRIGNRCGGRTFGATRFFA